MPYRITFDGSGSTAVRARTANDALALAETLAEQGKTKVQITTPAGETVALRQFRVLLREGKVDE